MEEIELVYGATGPPASQHYFFTRLIGVKNPALHQDLFQSEQY